MANNIVTTNTSTNVVTVNTPGPQGSVGPQGPAFSSGSMQLTGSLSLSGSFVDFTDASAGVSGSFSGSYEGDGTNLTGVTAEWDGTHVGNAQITGSLSLSGSLIPNGSGSYDLGSETNPWREIYVMSSSIKFMKPNAGVVATLGVDADGDFDFGDSALIMSGSQRVTGSFSVTASSGQSSALLDIGGHLLVESSGIVNMTSAAGISGSYFSGSFRGDGSSLTNIPASGVTGLALNKISSGSTHITTYSTGIIDASGSLMKLTGSLDVTGYIKAPHISGSFSGSFEGNGAGLTNVFEGTSASSSISTRLTTNESNISTNTSNHSSLVAKTLVSSSAQIAGDVSGSLGTNAALIRTLTSAGISGSFEVASASLASTTVTNANSISDLTSATGSYITTTGGQTIEGALTLTGNLTAHQYIVSTSVYNVTMSYSSGSHKFGDSIDDIQEFTGSLSISGSITGYPGVINQLTSSYAMTASYVGNSQYVHTQGSANTTWTISHGLGSQYLAISVYDSSDNYILPQQITATSTTATTLTFSAPQSGNAVVTIGAGARGTEGPSGSNDYTQLDNVPAGIVSSSAQISTAVSGAFGIPSASFSTRVTSLESNGVFTSAGISGSFTSTSSSLASRIASNETVTAKTLVSSSAQIATEVSGAFTSASASIATSISTNLTNISANTTNITSLTIVTGSYATTGSNSFVGDQTITGHITASGNISGSSTSTLSIGGTSTLAGANTFGTNGGGTAQTIYGTTTFSDAIQGNYHLTINGNTTLGNASTDRVTITGDVTASSNISSSITSTASFGTYLGDGSQLSGISTTPFPFVGDAVITGSLTISGSFSSFTLDAGNVVLGAGAGNSMLAAADDNVVIGTNAAQSLTTAHDSVIIGKDADGPATGEGSIVIGHNAGSYGMGHFNIAIGKDAMGASTAGAPRDNICLGYMAGQKVRGEKNIIIGRHAGNQFNYTEDYNILIGDNVEASSAAADSELRIGKGSVIPFSASLVTGDVLFPSTASAAYFSGDGSQLTNLPAVAGGIWSGSAADIRTGNGATVGITGSLSISGSTLIKGSGSGIFEVVGSVGTVFSVNDGLTGTLFEANNISGLPVIQAKSDNTVHLGKWGGYGITISGSTPDPSNPSAKISITGSTYFSGSVVDFTQVGTVSGIDAFPFVGDAVITGSLTISGSQVFTMDNNNVVLGANAGGGGINSGTDNANVIIGPNAAGEGSMNNGSGNILIGSSSAHGMTTGDHCVAIGTEALFAADDVGAHIAIGYRSLYNHDSGNSNIAIGYRAFYDTAGNGSSSNIVIGNNAGYAGVRSYNIAIGEKAMYNGSQADYNVVIGYQAGYVQGGDYNVAIGYEAGKASTTGENTILIGKDVEKSSATVSNEVKIGGGGVIPFSGSLVTGDVLFPSTASAAYFSGDGSQLTNLPSSSPFPLVGDAVITGSLTVTGHIAGATKSFLIDHPTKPGYKLQYGVLEGPEHGVYVRGQLTNENIIELPEEWVGLVHADSITVQLTPIGSICTHYVEDISDNKVHIDCECGTVNCFFFVQGERKDVDKLKTELE